MSEKNRKGSLFDKAKSEHRAQKILEENIGVADRYEATQPKPVTENTTQSLISSLMNKSKPKKETAYFYIETRIDDFFKDFADVIGTTKSEVVNELVLMLINDTEIMSEITDGNEDIQKLIEKFRQ